MNNFIYGFLTAGTISYIYNKKINIISKLIDFYVDIKYELNGPPKNPISKNQEINSHTPELNKFEKDNVVYINDGTYVYWHYNENEIKHSITSEINTHEFSIIKGKVNDPELFLLIIKKFAGFFGDFNGNIPNIHILNKFEPKLELTEKIIIENSNYEEFIISD